MNLLKRNSGFTLIELIVSTIIVVIIMAGATQFFLSFINTQVKGLEYLNMQQENMFTVQSIFQKIRRAEAAMILHQHKDPSLAVQSLLLKNSACNKEGPYTFIVPYKKQRQYMAEEKYYLLGIKDTLVFNDVEYVRTEQSLYYADTGNHVIRKTNTKTKENNIIAGTYAESGYNSDQRDATESLLNSPTSLVISANGDIYIADTENHRIRKIRAEDNKLIDYAGTGDPGFNETAGMLASESMLYYPSGMYLTDDGVLYFADRGNNRVRKIDQDGIISTVAGNGIPGFTWSSPDPLNASLNNPVDLTLDSEGNIYFTDAYNSRVVMIVKESGELKTFAGGNERAFYGDDGKALLARMNIPTGITLRSNIIYVSDSLNQIIRRIEPGADRQLGSDDDLIRTVVGFTGRVFLNAGEDLISDLDDVYTHTVKPRNGFGEGIAFEGGKSTDFAFSPTIRLNNPSGLTFDAEGNLYFVDSLNNRIRVLAGKNDPEGLILDEYAFVKYNYLYTLIENNENSEESIFRAFDQNAFTFNDLGDYLGNSELSKLTFYIDNPKDSHPLVRIFLAFSGEDVRSGIYAISNLQTTVGLRNYNR